jgi:hypothetical protein
MEFCPWATSIDPVSSTPPSPKLTADSRSPSTRFSQSTHSHLQTAAVDYHLALDDQWQQTARTGKRTIDMSQGHNYEPRPPYENDAML